MKYDRGIRWKPRERIAPLTIDARSRNDRMDAFDATLSSLSFNPINPPSLDRVNFISNFIIAVPILYSILKHRQF